MVFGQSRTTYGLFFDYGLNQHAADIRGFPGVPSCCPSYQDGSGSGFFAGALLQLPLTNHLWLDVRPGVASFSGTLTRTENVTVSGDVAGVFTHTIDANILSITVEPALLYEILPRFSARIGLSAGLLTTMQYSQIEIITQPDSGTFPNGERSRNEVNDQPIPNAASIAAGLVAGLSYDLPLNRDQTIFISPELSYYYGLTDLVNDVEWKVNQLRLGVALKWSPQSTETTPRNEPPLPSAPTDTTQTPIAAHDDVPFRAYLQARVVTNSNADSKEFVVTIEDFSSVQMTPLLKYVFFDQGSAVIPARYHQISTDQVKAFDEGAIRQDNKLAVYYDVLNIIGYRMTMFSDARIALVGCNANVGPEENNTLLSRQRAQMVRNYLHKVWGIDTSRIDIIVRNLPEFAANSSSNDGMQENRRVEIASQDERITAPLSTTGIIRNATPPYVTFTLRVDPMIDVATWKLETVAGERAFRTWSDSGMPPTNLEWRWTQIRNRILISVFHCVPIDRGQPTWLCTVRL